LGDLNCRPIEHIFSIVTSASQLLVMASIA
jgi:hypothetical protein